MEARSKIGRVPIPPVRHSRFVNSSTVIPAWRMIAQCACIEFPMIRDGDLREWPVTPYVDVASLLPDDDEACFAQSRDTLSPGNSRDLGHTSTS